MKHWKTLVACIVAEVIMDVILYGVAPTICEKRKIE